MDSTPSSRMRLVRLGARGPRAGIADSTISNSARRPSSRRSGYQQWPRRAGEPRSRHPRRRFDLGSPRGAFTGALVPDDQKLLCDFLRLRAPPWPAFRARNVALHQVDVTNGEPNAQFTEP